MEVKFKAEVISYLRIPSIPKKEWDGKTSFKDGVAVTNLTQGEHAYAVATFDADVDDEPRIKKVFAIEPYYGYDKIFVVPSYMDTDIENADLDEESKKAAERLVQEAEEIEIENSDEKPELPKSEWCFDEIHNIEEARAWLSNYNARNKIKGRVPRNEEAIKLRLLTIWKDLQTKKK